MVLFHELLSSVMTKTLKLKIISKIFFLTKNYIELLKIVKNGLTVAASVMSSTISGAFCD